MCDWNMIIWWKYHLIPFKMHTSAVYSTVMLVLSRISQQVFTIFFLHAEQWEGLVTRLERCSCHLCYMQTFTLTWRFSFIVCQNTCQHIMQYIPNSCVLSLLNFINLFKCAYVHVGGVKSKPNHRAQSGRRYVYTYILFQAYIPNFSMKF